MIERLERHLVLIVLLALVIVATARAQVYSNLDANVANWQIDTQHAGGNLKGVGTLSELTGTGPHGHALKATVTSSDGSGGNNVLFFTMPISSYSGPATTADYFYAEESFYVQSLTGVQVLEFDSLEYIVPWRFMFGTQCVIGGNWWAWNDNANSSGTGPGWIELNGTNGLPLVPCNVAVNQWHTWRQWSHHDPISQQLCAGFHNDKTPGNFPCSYQDVLEIDGVQYNVGYKSPGSDLPLGWASVLGVQFQMGQNSLGTQIQEGVADVYVTALGQ